MLPQNFIINVCGLYEVEKESLDTYALVISFCDPGTAGLLKKPYENYRGFFKKFEVHDAHSRYHLDSGLKPADDDLIKQIIDIGVSIKTALEIGNEVKVLCQCSMGISRSTAAAFIIACIVLGDGRERKALSHVIQARDVANPNPHFIKIADRLLQRNGRMLEALKYHGRYWNTDI